ncbi:unnamed protein product [marine sediment metagenome]|uniref:Uncharacterized protein n=1 Tax=marine sediment metagenome TaxID=412755 RepID=X1J4N8_9ZZZZ
MQQFEVYKDTEYRLTLAANGMYTLEEFENGQWYASATGPYNYILMVLRDHKLDRIISAIT